MGADATRTRVCCYTPGDAVEAAVRAVGGDVMRAASEQGAAVRVRVRCRTSDDTRRAVGLLELRKRGHLLDGYGRHRHRRQWRR